jgi:hypothetical protein
VEHPGSTGGGLESEDILERKILPNAPIPEISGSALMCRLCVLSAAQKNHRRPF